MSDVSPVSQATAKPGLSPEELFKQLEHLLLEDMASDEQIFDWVEVRPIPWTSLIWIKQFCKAKLCSRKLLFFSG